LTSVFFFIILFMNFKIFVFFGKNVTLSEILIVLSVLYLIVLSVYNKYEMKFSIVVAFFLFILITPLISAYFSSDLLEGLKSFSQSLLSSSFVVLAYVFKKYHKRPVFITAFIYANVFLASYGILQFLCIRVFGLMDQFIVYPFMDYTAQVQSLFCTIGPLTWRSNSLYYEPSIFGIFCTYAFLLVVYTDIKNRLLIKSLLFLGVISSLSTAALLIFVICAGFQQLSKTSNPISPRRSLLRFFLFAITFAIILLLISSFVPTLLNTFSRLNELSAVGSSGFYRIIAPYQFAIYVFSNYIFGLGIGNIESFIESQMPENLSYYFQKGSGVGTSVDNTAMLLFITFGYLGFLYIFLIILFLILAKRKVGFSIILFLILFHFVSGHLYTPYYWLIYVPLADLLILPQKRRKNGDFRKSLNQNSIG